MSNRANNIADELHAEIRKQFTSPATKRFVRSLPSFQVDQKLPDRLASLLMELDNAQTRQQNGNEAARQDRKAS